MISLSFCCLVLDQFNCSWKTYFVYICFCLFYQLTERGLLKHSVKILHFLFYLLVLSVFVRLYIFSLCFLLQQNLSGILIDNQDWSQLPSLVNLELQCLSSKNWKLQETLLVFIAP